MASSVGGAARYMAYSPSPSAPPSPHLSGLRSAAAAAAASSAAALLDQEKYHSLDLTLYLTFRSDRLFFYLFFLLNLSLFVIYCELLLLRFLAQVLMNRTSGFFFFFNMI